MTASELLLTVDGGGSKTDVCIVRVIGNEKPEILGRARGGPTNLTSLGVDVVIAEIARLLERASSEANIPNCRFSRAIVGLAGGGDRSACQQVERWLIGGVCDAARVISDAELILSVAESLAPEGNAAIALLVGTGSVAFYRGPKSLEVSRAGGWGPILGDDGSGYWMGRAAIRRLLQTADEGGEYGDLSQAVFRQMGVHSARLLIGKINNGNERTPTIASLAPLVVASAEGGDPVAKEILQEAAIYIGVLMGTVLTRLKHPPQKTVVACAGSVIARNTVFKKSVGDLLQISGISEVYFIDDPASAAIPLVAQRGTEK